MKVRKKSIKSRFERCAVTTKYAGAFIRKKEENKISVGFGFIEYVL